MVKLDQHYIDPRLVSLYDIENPRGIDTDFYLNLASEINAKRIIDLGCGTGILTHELATANRQVIGVDPAQAMLALARQKANADTIRWIEGDASAMGQWEADLLVMTGNVAQVFLDDTQWQTTLKHIHAALRSGGYLAFESRNPAKRAWEGWNRETTYAELESSAGMVQSWLDVVGIGEGVVHFEGQNIFLETGEHLTVPSTLRFRTEDELRCSLHEAGFTVEALYGNWEKAPFAAESPLMIFVASRN